MDWVWIWSRWCSNGIFHYDFVDKLLLICIYYWRYLMVGKMIGFGSRLMRNLGQNLDAVVAAAAVTCRCQSLVAGWSLSAINLRQCRLNGLLFVDWWYPDPSTDLAGWWHFLPLSPWVWEAAEKPPPLRLIENRLSLFIFENLHSNSENKKQI